MNDKEQKAIYDKIRKGFGLNNKSDAEEWQRAMMKEYNHLLFELDLYCPLVRDDCVNRCVCFTEGRITLQRAGDTWYVSIIWPCCRNEMFEKQ